MRVTGSVLPIRKRLELKDASRCLFEMNNYGGGEGRRYEDILLFSHKLMLHEWLGYYERFKTIYDLGRYVFAAVWNEPERLVSFAPLTSRTLSPSHPYNQAKAVCHKSYACGAKMGTHSLGHVRSYEIFTTCLSRGVKKKVKSVHFFLSLNATTSSWNTLNSKYSTGNTVTGSEFMNIFILPFPDQIAKWI